MGHTLILEVPEDVYEPLAKTAEQRGATPEKLAVEWLVIAIHKAVDDPIENFIGAFSSDIPDWADEHDKYVGLALMQQMRSEGDRPVAPTMLLLNKPCFVRARGISSYVKEGKDGCAV